MQAVDSLVRSQEEEFAFAVDDIEGALPQGLDGVLFRNGGGTMQVGNDPLAFLDGYGMVGAFEVADGNAFLRTAYPRTSVRESEQAAGQMLKRRVFTNLPQRWKNVFNIDPAGGASHDTYVWNDHVYASDLGSHWALSLPKLDTDGEAPWPFGNGQLAAPMPRDDPRRKTLVAYALRQTATGGAATFVEVDENFKEVARTPSTKLSGLIHDLAFTDDWYVLVESAGKPRPLAALLGSVPLWSSFGWKDVGPTLILIPRGREGEVVRIPLDTQVRLAFHIVNAYDDDGDVIVDVIGYDAPVSFDLIMPAARGKTLRPTPNISINRIRAVPGAGSATVTLFDGAHGEPPEIAPAVQGQPYRWAWFTALPSVEPDLNNYTLTHTLASLDVVSGTWSTWDAGAGHQVSPPAFAPDPSRDDPEAGWILSWDLDLEAETCDVIVLDAQNIAAGTIARAKLGVYLPAVSHCRFAPGLRVSA